MKYKTLLAFALVAALGFTTCSVFAEELGAKPVNQENTEVLFGDLNDLLHVFTFTRDLLLCSQYLKMEVKQ